MRIGLDWPGAAWLMALLIAAAHVRGIFTPPFVLDTLGAIQHAFKSIEALWLGQTSAIQPFYRPLPFSFMKLEVALAGVHVPMLFLGTLVFLVLVFVVLYALARREGVPAVLAAAGVLVVATDGIWAIPMVWLSDRQALLAILFGLLAVLVLRAPRSWAGLALAVVCMVAAVLSKETAFAFVPALAWLAWTRGKQPWSQAVIVVLVAVACLMWRAVMVGGIASGEGAPVIDTGFFHAHRSVRYAELLLLDRLQLNAYTAAANFIGIFYRPAFDSIGAINPDGLFAARGNLAPAALTLLALIGFALRWRTAAPYLFVILGTALVGMFEYRARNHMPGTCALAIVALLGLQALVDRRRLIGWVAVGLCLVAFAAGALRLDAYYRAMAARILAAHRAGDLAGADISTELVRLVRRQCTDRPQWCVLDHDALHRAGLQ